MNPNYRSDVLIAYLFERERGRPALDAIRTARLNAKYHPRSKSKSLYVLDSRYVLYEGEQITELANGWKIKVSIEYDPGYGPPWKECDGMGVIEESRSFPGEYGEYDDWILNHSQGWYRYYDWKATLPEALRDGWNTAPYHFHTDRERAMAAMKSTCDYLRRWCNDEWWYVGYIVELLDEDDNVLNKDSCWGFESDSVDVLCETVRDVAAHMIKGKRKVLRAQREYERWEARERAYWAERDVVTE